MEFLEGNQITEKVIDILKGNDVICAVAFWGTDAKSFLEAHCPNPAAVQIVCDIHLGGTPAKALEELMTLNPTKLHAEKLRWRRGLHGKVFVSSVGAVIGSANASDNGLGLRGGPPFQPGLREAAVFVHAEADKEAYDKARGWALKQFESDGSGDTGVVDDNALAIAKRRYRPVPPLKDFDGNSLFDTVLTERKAFGNLAFVLTDESIDEDRKKEIYRAIEASSPKQWVTNKPKADSHDDNDDLIDMRPVDAQVWPPRFIHIWAPKDSGANITLLQRGWREDDRGGVYAPEVTGSVRGIFGAPLPKRKLDIDDWFASAARTDFERARKLLIKYNKQKEAVFFVSADAFAEEIEALERR